MALKFTPSSLPSSIFSEKCIQEFSEKSAGGGMALSSNYKALFLRQDRHLVLRKQNDRKYLR